MVIGFKTRFVEPINNGFKTHTIRRDPKNRWKPGMTMHMYTGGRYSKEYRQFDEKTCTAVQQICMIYKPDDIKIEIKVDGHSLPNESLAKLITLDGFDSQADFFQWWAPELAKLPDNTFNGKIIHWDEDRY